MQKQQSQPRATHPKTEGKAAAQPTCAMEREHGARERERERESEREFLTRLGLVTGDGLTLHEGIGPSVGEAQPKTSL